MRRRPCALLLIIASLLLPAGARVAAEHAVRGQTAAAPAASAKIWEGRNAEFEAYLRDAEIDHFEDIPLGVTHPKRAYLKPGGLVASVAWKVLPPGRPNGYWESYKAEIAAYELDKLLGMGMVPVAVEKTWKREKAAAIMWLSPVHPWKEMQDRPKPASWVPQVARMKMLDDLICNRIATRGTCSWTINGTCS